MKHVPDNDLDGAKPTSSPKVLSRDQKRDFNRKLALIYVRKGLAVLPVDDRKATMAIAYGKLADTMTDDERDNVISDWQATTGKDYRPKYIGSTRKEATVLKWFHDDNVFGVALQMGLNNLYVVDADQKLDGPAKMKPFWQEHGGIPQGAIRVPTQSGGYHLYLRNPGDLGNTAGRLKDLGCDIRGKGGYCVAPGMQFPRGSYGDKSVAAEFINAFTIGTIPVAPAYIIEATRIPASSQAANVGEGDIASKAAELRTMELLDFNALFGDDDLAKYDLNALAAKDSSFAWARTAHETEVDIDTSTVRWNVAKAVRREWPEMTFAEFAVLIDNILACGVRVDGKPNEAGEYNERNIVRDFERAKPKHSNSDGSAFGAVEENEADEEAEGDQRKGDSVQKIKRSKLDRLRAKYTRLEDFRETPPQIEWCVKHVMARKTTNFWVGKWGSGKTAAAIDIGLHVAADREWNGKKVEQGLVVYCALENPSDVERRVFTWCLEHGVDRQKVPFIVYHAKLGLFSADATATLDEKDLIDIINMEAEHFNVSAALVFIDTASKSMRPGRENSNDDAAIYVAAMQRISDLTGANVTTLAHPPKGGTTVRGGGAFEADVDTVLHSEKEAKGGIIKLFADSDKFRIGDPSKARFRYRLKANEIGQDEDGDPIEVVLASFTTADPTAKLGPVESETEAPDHPWMDLSSPEAKREAVLTGLRNADGPANMACIVKEANLAALSGCDVQTITATANGIWPEGFEPLKRTTVQSILNDMIRLGEIPPADGSGKRTTYRAE